MTFAEWTEHSIDQSHHDDGDEPCQSCKLRQALIQALSPFLPTTDDIDQAIADQKGLNFNSFDMAPCLAVSEMAVLVMIFITKTDPTSGSSRAEQAAGESLEISQFATRQIFGDQTVSAAALRKLERIAATVLQPPLTKAVN